MKLNTSVVGNSEKPGGNVNSKRRRPGGMRSMGICPAKISLRTHYLAKNDS